MIGGNDFGRWCGGCAALMGYNNMGHFLGGCVPLFCLDEGDCGGRGVLMGFEEEFFPHFEHGGFVGGDDFG